jgi:hypothetical protein
MLVTLAVFAHKFEANQILSYEPGTPDKVFIVLFLVVENGSKISQTPALKAEAVKFAPVACINLAPLAVCAFSDPAKEPVPYSAW